MEASKRKKQKEEAPAHAAMVAPASSSREAAEPAQQQRFSNRKKGAPAPAIVASAASREAAGETDPEQRILAASKKKEAMVPVAASSKKEEAPVSMAVATSSGEKGAPAHWEWCSDSLLWNPYLPSSSAIIEAAFQSGQPCANFNVARSSYTVSFQPLGPRQKNLTTGRTRPVRRQSTENGVDVTWQWWDKETQHWHAYEAELAAQIEGKWKECNLSKAFSKQNAPAGLFFFIHGQAYSIEFETDAVQYNLKTRFSRGVRRYSCLQSSGSSSLDGVTVTTLVADSATHHQYDLNSGGGAQFLGQSGCEPSSSSALTRASFSSGTNDLHGSSQTQSRSDITGSETRDESLDKPSYNVEDFIDYPSPLESEDCSICLSSLRENKAVLLMKCKHSYHRGCIESWFQSRPTCPECLTVYGVIVGTQPDGEMHVGYIARGSKEAKSGLAGYPNTDIIRITYRFPSGIQTAEHPNPGRPYAGTVRIAYLPKNEDGEEVLELLKKAWSRRLLFRVGTSVTTGRSDVVTWSGIHHKTSITGGSSNHGYPDETYLARVKKELEDFGVT